MKLNKMDISLNNANLFGNDIDQVKKRKRKENLRYTCTALQELRKKNDHVSTNAIVTKKEEIKSIHPLDTSGVTW